MWIIIEVEDWKVIYRTDKQEFQHFFTGKSDNKPRGLKIK